MGQFWPRSCRPQDAGAETQEIIGIPARLRRCGWPDTRGKRTVGTVHHARACAVASTTVPISRTAAGMLLQISFVVFYGALICRFLGEDKTEVFAFRFHPNLDFAF